MSLSVPNTWLKFVSLTLCLSLLLALGSCSNSRFLRPHKIAIQQGNMITQETVDRLKPGMTKSQVNFVMGTPLIVDTLNSDQWHYVYRLRTGAGNTLTRKLAVIFVDGKLHELQGDYKPSAE